MAYGVISTTVNGPHSATCFRVTNAIAESGDGYSCLHEIYFFSDSACTAQVDVSSGTFVLGRMDGASAEFPGYPATGAFDEQSGCTDVDSPCVTETNYDWTCSSQYATNTAKNMYIEASFPSSITVGCAIAWYKSDHPVPDLAASQYVLQDCSGSEPVDLAFSGTCSTIGECSDGAWGRTMSVQFLSPTPPTMPLPPPTPPIGPGLGGFGWTQLFDTLCGHSSAATASGTDQAYSTCMVSGGGTDDECKLACESSELCIAVSVLETPDSSSCLRIETGTADYSDGTLDVSVDQGAGYAVVISGETYAKGSTVVDACYATFLGVQVTNPSADGWIGTIELSTAPLTIEYLPLSCTDCTVTGSTAEIVVDGDGNGAGSGDSECLNGATCTLVPLNDQCYMSMPAATDCSSISVASDNSLYGANWTFYAWGGSAYASETCDDMTETSYGGYACWCKESLPPSAPPSPLVVSIESFYNAPPPSPAAPPPSPPPSSPGPLFSDLTVQLDASNPSGYDGSGNAFNLVTGQQWTNAGGSASCPITTHEGVAVFDMEDVSCYFRSSEAIDYCGSANSFTTATWIDWRDADGAWRTLHRPSGDHIVLAHQTTNELGVYLYPLVDDFFGTGYYIDTEGWHLVITVTEDDDCAADGGIGGTTKFYVGNVSTAPTLVGTADNAAGAGRYTYYFGFADQGPGKVAVTWAWNRDLSTSAIEQLWTETLSYVVVSPPPTPPIRPSPPPVSPPPSPTSPPLPPSPPVLPPGMTACLRIVTGTDAYNNGTLDVYIEQGSGYEAVTSGASWSSGETVVQACYATLNAVRVTNPTTDAWSGSVYLSEDGGEYLPLFCSDCTEEGSSAYIAVDGDSNGAFLASTNCLNGAWCSLIRYSETPDGWFVSSAAGLTCDAVCEENGRLCNDTALWGRNDEVDSATELKGLMARLGVGVTCENPTGERGSAIDVPNFKDSGWCYYSETNRSSESVYCSGSHYDAYRLCLCSMPPSPSSPPVSPPSPALPPPPPPPEPLPPPFPPDSTICSVSNCGACYGVDQECLYFSEYAACITADAAYCEPLRDCGTSDRPHIDTCSSRVCA